jgi:hypothetical protein
VITRGPTLRSVTADPLNRRRSPGSVADPHHLHHALQVVRQDVKAHLRSYSRQRLHQEVRRSHPGFERSERVLDREAPDRALTGRAAVRVAAGIVDEVALVEATVRLAVATTGFAIVRMSSLSLAQICAKPLPKVISAALGENIFFANSHRNFSSLGLRSDFRSDHATSIAFRDRLGAASGHRRTPYGPCAPVTASSRSVVLEGTSNARRGTWRRFVIGASVTTALVKLPALCL